MENLDDEEIQRLTEQQINSAESITGTTADQDAQLYRTLFTELKHDPAKAQTSIADAVIRQIIIQQERAERIYYGLVIGAVALVISALTYFAVKKTDNSLLDKLSQFLLDNKMICIFILCAFCAIQLLDRFLTKRYRQTREG